MKTEYRYIFFVELSSGRETTVWACANHRETDMLGIVSWYSPWRQYCFTPTAGAYIVLSKGCMEDINDFIAQLMKARAA